VGGCPDLLSIATMSRLTTRCFSVVTLSSGNAGDSYASRRVIPRYEHVPVPPQIPKRISLSANAGASGFRLFRVGGKTLLFAQAATPSAPPETSS
jgi:hypothetical protein